MKNKLILLKRIKPEIFEVHINEVRQTKNILFSTKDGELAQRVVDSFNRFKRVENKLNDTKNDLGVKGIILNQVSKAYKKKLSELTGKVKKLETKKKK
jgi:hypothetical protein